ncbi:MAG: stage IV sporulation protein A [Lachnospiraceae bacterium]|nr:stage IV sporulation protein A [Lachnospiraceae bacterium]
MDNFQIYRDIESRTGGEIYIGVVGPVRTGKSTFIKRFMETMVLPEVPDGHEKTLMRDELPQSAAGKTIMTTEPKFIPKDAVSVCLDEKVQLKIRMVDCVGFMVDGASGHEENGEDRMVHTPWFEHEIPFASAAEIGTEKVIRDHSTIGMIVTTDGSIGDLTRECYLQGEKRAVEELKAIGKPFVILLNSVRPYAEEVGKLADELEKQYGTSVLPMNCEQLKKDDVVRILETVLKEFPITRVDFHIPRWLEIMDHSHPMKQSLLKYAKTVMESVNQMRDITDDLMNPSDFDENLKIRSVRLNMDDGTVELDVCADEDVYYQVISEHTGLPVEDEYELFRLLSQMSELQKEYEKVRNALQAVRAKGYGIVMPDKAEIVLQEPELIKHGNKYGVKIHAHAPSINLIKAHVETEIAPIVGSEQQAKDLIAYIKNNESSEDGVWETNIFGKSVEQIVEDGMQAKISQMTEECQSKLQDTLQKIINDSNGGMICIII